MLISLPLQLCASGTVGVAAIGFAFGHPQHSIAARPTSKKRKTPSRSTPSEAQPLPAMPSTPSPLPQSTSAPTSRLRKRSSAGRPLTSASNLRGGTRTLDSTPEARLDNGSDDIMPGQSLRPQEQDSPGSIAHGTFAFEFKGVENTPPTWLRRMSTLSSLKSGSPAPTDRLGSPSIAHSNGSTAPILPGLEEPSSGTLPRNKLVKRSSSQRALYGSGGPHSSLRRPATSHQRSATLQQQSFQDEGQARSSLGASSILPSDLSDNHQSYDESAQLWQPFFKPYSANTAKDGASRKRNANGMTNRNEAQKIIVPGITELPTLLLATSISSGSSNEPMNSRVSNISALSRPFTPFDHAEMSTPIKDETHSDSEPKPRHSISLSEIFPSPSPSTWKMPRLGSLRKSKPFNKGAGGRRVVSAPQSTNHRYTRSTQSRGLVEGQAFSGRDLDDQESPTLVRSRTTDLQQRGSSSTLPPLNRLSTFEVDLPSTVPSYPSTPQPGNMSSPQEPSSQSPLSVTYPLSQSIPKTRPHRFSSAPSEPGSTLLGSDNDNSRLLSGDEDDIDARSETIYDSTRTGATGSSHSGMRRPPIDTIFDESPPPRLPSNPKLVALQDLLQKHSFDEHDLIEHRAVVEEEHEVSTPVRRIVPCKEEGSPTPLHNTSEIFLSPEASSSPTNAELKTASPLSENVDPDLNDELWAIDNPNKLHAKPLNERRPSLQSGDGSPVGSLRRPHAGAPRRRESPPASGLDQSSKSNIFEWSEQPSTDRDSSRGGSPRPSTVHGRQMKDMRGSRVNGRRGPSALHLRSQSVPVPKDMASRHNNNSSKLDSWVLGNKGPSEDWDGDFEFDEASNTPKQALASGDHMPPSAASGMLVPRAILERQASVHGQFGQVKELTLLVEELKRLQQQAAGLGIMEGQSVELWKEAEGIINLATLDDEEQELFPPRSPLSPSFDFDLFDDDSPSIRVRRKSGISQSKDERLRLVDDSSESQNSSRPSQELSGLETPPSTRPRKESSAKAKSVLETIYQQRSHHDPALLDAPLAQRKLPFDTTSLKDLVTRAGVVTRALKEIVRRADTGSDTPEQMPSTPRDPPFIAQMFQQPPSSSALGKSPRVTHSPKSPKSPKSQRSSPFLGGSITGNDNEINGHMKMMTVV